MIDTSCRWNYKFLSMRQKHHPLIICKRDCTIDYCEYKVILLVV